MLPTEIPLVRVSYFVSLEDIRINMVKLLKGLSVNDL
jgi:hypothetical protein